MRLRSTREYDARWIRVAPDDRAHNWPPAHYMRRREARASFSTQWRATPRFRVKYPRVNYSIIASLFHWQRRHDRRIYSALYKRDIIRILTVKTLLRGTIVATNIISSDYLKYMSPVITLRSKKDTVITNDIFLFNFYDHPIVHIKNS